MHDRTHTRLHIHRLDLTVLQQLQPGFFYASTMDTDSSDPSNAGLYGHTHYFSSRASGKARVQMSVACFHAIDMMAVEV